MAQARGTFEVALNPLDTYGKPERDLSGRMSIDKKYSGDLQGTGKGEMLTAGPTPGGSGGYVAIENVSGTLHGMKGGFILQHSGTMNKNSPRLSVTVVPDSGTGELEGITGSFSIEIVKGRHSYSFEYELK
jgi:hypothetical protein